MKKMERYIRFVIGHKRAVIVAISLVTLFLGYECKNLRVAIKLKEQLPQNHPYVQIYNKLGDLFGSGEGNESVLIIGVAATDKTEGSIYNPKIVQKVVDITNGLLDMPFVVRNSIVSFSAPKIKAIQGRETIDISPLINSREPVTGESAKYLEATLAKDSTLREILTNPKSTATIIVMDVDGSQPDKIITSKIKDLAKRAEDESVDIFIAGGPMLRMEINRYSTWAFALILVAIVIIGLIHYQAFRTRQAAIFPLITAVLSTVWAMGILGITGRPLDSWSAITPIIILAVAAGHAVQILKRYYEEFAKIRDSKEAVVRTMCAVGPVMLRVGIIASFGFGSLMFMGVRSVQVFGLLLSAGILSALVIEMTLIPAWRSGTTPSIRESSREMREGFIERIMARIANWATIHTSRSFLATVFVVAFFCIGIQWMEVNNNIYRWLPKSSSVRKSYEHLTNELGGVTPFKLWVEGTHNNAIKEPQVLAALNDLEKFLQQQPHINRVSGFASIIYRMHRAMSGENAVPLSAGLVEQYLLLYPVDALDGIVDNQFKNSVVVGFSSDDSTNFIDHTFKTIRDFADHRFVGLPVTIHVAGGALAVNAAMDQVVIKEKWRNMIQVSSVIFVLATLFLGSFVGGVFVLIPMVLALAVNLGMMGWFSIWFDMTSAAITSMGISIGADFAIYFLYRVREEVAHCDTQTTFEDAVRRALLTSGKAIFYVSSAVIGGFMVLYLSPFLVWQHLAVLTSLIILVHALSVIVLLPSLIIYFRPKFLYFVQNTPPLAEGMNGNKI